MAVEQPKKPSAMGGILGVVVATVLAVAGGGGGGIFMAQTLSASLEDSMKKDGSKGAAKSASHGKSGDGNGDKKDDHGKSDSHGQAESDSHPMSRITLAPITTNLAAPGRAWIRLEVSVRQLSQSDQEQDELIKQLHEDILGFLRTLTLSQIQGPSGFQHMREDLNERVRIRSKGTIDKLLIHALVVE